MGALAPRQNQRRRERSGASAINGLMDLVRPSARPHSEPLFPKLENPNPNVPHSNVRIYEVNKELLRPNVVERYTPGITPQSENFSPGDTTVFIYTDDNGAATIVSYPPLPEGSLPPPLPGTGRLVRKGRRTQRDSKPDMLRGAGPAAAAAMRPGRGVSLLPPQVQPRPSLRLDNMGAKSKSAIATFATPKEKLKIGLKLKPLPRLDAASQRVQDAMAARREPKPLRLSRPKGFRPKTISATPIDTFGQGALRADRKKLAGQAAYEAKKRGSGLGRLREREAAQAARSAAAQRRVGRKLNQGLRPSAARRPLATPRPAKLSPKPGRMPIPRGMPTLGRGPVAPRIPIPQRFPSRLPLPSGVGAGVAVDLITELVLPNPLNSEEDSALEFVLSFENAVRQNDINWRAGQILEIRYPWEDLMFSVRSPNNLGDQWSTFLISGTLKPDPTAYEWSFNVSQQYTFKPLVYSTEPWINRQSVIVNETGGPSMDMITATIVPVSGWQPQFWDLPKSKFPDIEWWVLAPPEELAPELERDPTDQRPFRRLRPGSPPLVFEPPPGLEWPDFPHGIEIEPQPHPGLDSPTLPLPRWRPVFPGRWPGFRPPVDDPENPWRDWDDPSRPQEAIPGRQYPGSGENVQLPPLPTTPSQWRWTTPETGWSGGDHSNEEECEGENCFMTCRFNLAAIQRVTAAQHVQTQAAITSNHTNTQTVIKADNATNKAGIISAILDALGQFSMQSITSKLDDALARLGPKLPNGGLSGKIERMAKFFRFEKIVNLLTLITALHNAAMLSRSLASTLGEVASQLLNAVGIKDEEGQAIDVNETLSKSANDFMESLLGKSVWDGLQDNWKKANSIYQAGAQVIWSVRSLTDSMRDIAEWTASNTGRIGNALKKFRVVGENAYPWMNENVKAQGRWFQKIDAAKARIETYDEAASSFGGFLGAGIGAREEFEEAVEAKDRFTDLLEKGLPGLPKENEPVKDSAATAKAASQSPAIAPTDLPRAES